MHKLFMSAGAHRASNLSTLPERKAAFLSPQNSSKRLRGCSVTTITAVYPQERFQEADISMTFPGKLPSVLLLVLLAAQGKRSGPPPFLAPHEPVASPKEKKKWAAVAFVMETAPYLHDMCAAFYYITCKLSAAQTHCRGRKIVLKEQQLIALRQQAGCVIRTNRTNFIN